MRKRCAAFYIRLSDADEEVKKGFKDESNSISAQRDLLYSFVRNDTELAELEILEYFDDGLSGTGFENFILFILLLLSVLYFLYILL